MMTSSKTHFYSGVRFSRGLLLIAYSVLVTCLFAQPAFAQDVSTIEKEQTTFDLGIGFEHFKVGGVKFGGKYNYTLNPAPMPLVSTNEQHDGKLNGVRTDALIRTPGRSLGLNGVVSFRGFYAQFRVRSTLDCASVSSANCDGTSLFDPSINANNRLGSHTAGANYVTNRKVQHWGMAIDVASDEYIDRLQQRFGIGYRTIDQNMDLMSTWAVSGNSQNYNEKLRTHYIGTYWGESGRHTLSPGFDLVYSGEAGVYWAHTTYDGALNQRDFSGTFSQNLDMKRNKAAFIGALEVALRKKFQGFALMGYLRGEYYSYAPQMDYNQTNRGNGVGSSAVDIFGPNDGTHINNTKAWNAMIGARLSVPF